MTLLYHQVGKIKSKTYIMTSHFFLHILDMDMYLIHQDLKTKYSLIKVSQKKHGLVLLALVSKFEDDASTSQSGKK